MNINPTRLTGLASGLDTDTLVKQMMQPYQTKMDKMMQDKQIVQWKQDLYRDILSDVNNFKSTYFDVLRSDTYMLSSNSFAGYDVTNVSSATSTSSGVTIEAFTGAVVGDYEITVNELAKNAITESVGDFLSNNITKSSKLSDLGINDSTEFKIQYGTTGIDGSNNVISPTTYTVTANSNMTVQGLIDLVAKETKGNVKLSFSELTGKFKVETVKMGDNSALKLENATWQDKLKLDLSAHNGQNANVDIKAPGMATSVNLTKKTNSFTVDGVKYTLTKKGTDSTVINIKSNVTKPFEKIVGFVNKYNELIDKIDKKASEKKQYTYLPLTEEQKEDMSEDEIKKWEEKAKEGLLKGDSNLQNMLTELRRAVYDGVKDAGIDISSIGISTFSDTSQRGKLQIDETKLKAALENTPDKVASIFIKSSNTVASYHPDLSKDERLSRWNEQGILRRFDDILKDYTRTNRNKDGKKGILIEKAGIKGDLSEFKNLLTEDIDKRDKLILQMKQKLYDKENRFYTQFAKLETAMNQLNSQSSWLTQQLGGS